MVRRRTTRQSATTAMRLGTIIAPLRRSDSPQTKVSRAGAASTITLQFSGGERRKITGLFNKKLIQALTEAGIRRD